MPPLPLRLRTFLRWLPCKPLLCLTCACLLLEEQYPFSNFPMYSSFHNETYYVYLANGADEPLPTLTLFGKTTPTLKKIYDGEMRLHMRRLHRRRKELTTEEKRTIGSLVLRRLKASAAPLGSTFPDVLRLYDVQIELVGGQVERRRNLVAELR
ncbi:MAG: hypothetical protein ABI883_02660 [Chthoniobacterales bacterium]